MPRISAPTLAEHRDMRRTSLLDAGRDLVLSGGPRAVTMAAVAGRAGLSRPAVYEYFPSSEALLGELLLQEMTRWSTDITAIVSAAGSPADQVTAYVRSSLGMVASGRHRLSSVISPNDIDAEAARNLMALHHSLAAPLVGALAESGVAQPDRAAMLLQGVVQAAGRRIDSGADPETETATALAFVLAGVEALAAPPAG
jgi:AcrR family transcriptional regulator